MRYQTINPTTEDVIDEYETMTESQVLEIVHRSHQAFLTWRTTPVRRRAEYFTGLARTLRKNRDRYAGFMTLEMGKPITEARAEIEKCAWLCDVYVENAETWLKEESVAADGKQHLVAYDPLGVIFSIMPWNFPYWQALRFAVPAIIAGNTSILKHAGNVPQCAFAIEEAFVEAGFPSDIFRNILADHATVNNLIANDLVRGISLTGSTEAGMRIGEAAGRNLKKVVLELGGSDPFIVLDDADVEVAARNAVTGRTMNTGQSCIAAKRFIVMENVADRFAERFAERMAALVVGNPMDEATQMGPMVNKAALEELRDQLEKSVAMGARVLTGGRRLDGKGFFFAPTVVVDTTPDMPVVKEEVFGPIAPVIIVRDDNEAIRVANATEFGLGGSVWTRDTQRGLRMARQIEAGSIFVNSIVKSDPRMPFGGVKKSGFGRELARFGLREFVNIKGLNVYEHR